MKTTRKSIYRGMKPFTPGEVRYVVKHWAMTPNDKLDKRLNRPYGSVSYLAQKIKSAGYKLPRKTPVNDLRSVIVKAFKTIKQ